MKKNQRGLIVFAFACIWILVTTSSVVAQTITASGVATTYTADMNVGSKGDAVSRLQTFLEAQGFLKMPEGVSRGYYGLLTKAAVAQFQENFKIVQKGAPGSGRTGPMTRAKINEIMEALSNM